MHDHDACEEAICTAMARNDHGRAEYLAARCDLKHGALLATDSVTPTPAAPVAAQREEV